MYKFLFLVLLVAGVNAQCDYSSESLCENNENCSWFEDISYGNCYTLTVQQCYHYTGECYVDSEPGWYDSSGPYCTGGTYQIDNSYCVEILMPECYELNENACTHPLYGEGCEWILDDSIDCGNMNTESSCNSNNCDWNEDIEIINCSTLSTSGWGPGSCEYYYPDCYEYLDYGGWYGSWSTECGGGTVQIDSSYCGGESGYCQDSLILGDINNDSIINVLDVVQIVNSILNSESYNYIADINNDASVDVLDVIEIINMIINGD